MLIAFENKFLKMLKYQQMLTKIDTGFNVYSDTPLGKDPDSCSPTLKSYHRFLWSKPLPHDADFQLIDSLPKVLYHQSNLGEFFLSSDSIGHTYRNVKSMSHIVSQIPSTELETFFNLCSTIAGYVIFPSKKINNMMTINGARGMNRSIKDRFDLTLECIRMYYQTKPNPLSDTLKRYSSFFGLFGSFKGYVDFFLLQDLVSDNCSSIKFFLPFVSFSHYPLPQNIDEYRLYKLNLMAFLIKRNHRIKEFADKTI